MGKRSNIKTTIQQAVDYWASRIDECELSVDWSEADRNLYVDGKQNTVAILQSVEIRKILESAY